ncbi:phosphatidylinositol mannoside acyltransferase [Georgenia faecalis]|uniref:Phosphatidylinositol mannoside acyltransferase n=1 Tax=Georgenia faecalis TaxID=2483799 RepID=A0ABV9DCH0_9MICO|nr:phosphatidylinositol mannoside acyltransferase [Georgenia faecalis]
MRIDGATLVRIAHLAHRLPVPVTRAAFTLAADVAWASRTTGVRQLEANLARVRPAASAGELRRLSRVAMRSYMRYYDEAIRLPAVDIAQRGQRVRAEGTEPLRAHLADGGSVIVALTHSGNWDLAGAWAEHYLGHVVTVAERLQPEELFTEFLTFREGLGMTIIPLEKDGSTFRELLRRARSEAAVIPLLADRDLSRGGVEVDLVGHPARIAAGPAALAVATGRPLYAASIFYERLHGARRKAAGSRWGIRVVFSDEIARPAGASKDEAIRLMTQAWVDIVGEYITEHPEDWHMLQKVFVADLDPERLARAGVA